MRTENYRIDRTTKGPFSLSDLRQVFADWVMRLKPIVQVLQTTLREKKKQKPIDPKKMSSDAVFLGWQKTPGGEVFALYNVTAEQHRLYHSTVSEKTLRQEHLDTPPTPVPEAQLKRFDYEK